MTTPATDDAALKAALIASDGDAADPAYRHGFENGYRAAAPAMQWRGIESAPRDGSYILLGRKGDSWPSTGFWNDKTWDDGDYYADLGSFTHWMPLPPAPEHEG